MKNIRQYLYQLLLRIVTWLLEKEKRIAPSLTLEQERGLLSQLWENPAFAKYLDARERHLIDDGMQRFIEGKLTEARGLSGQLIEIRALRLRVRSAWLILDKQRKEKREALVKEK